MVYDPPVLYELLSDRDLQGSRLLVQVVHDPAKGKPAASVLKQTIRWMAQKAVVKAMTGFVYRYGGSAPDGEPGLLMKFYDSGNYIELSPIDCIDIERYEKANG